MNATVLFNNDNIVLVLDDGTDVGTFDYSQEGVRSLVDLVETLNITKVDYDTAPDMDTPVEEKINWILGEI